MPAVLSDLARQQFLSGSINWTSDTFKIVAINATYTYGTTDHNLSDIASGERVFLSSASLASKTATNGLAGSAPLTQAAVAAGSTIVGYWLYKSTGTESTSTLIAFYDINKDSTAVYIVTDGGDVIFTPDPDTLAWFRL